MVEAVYTVSARHYVELRVRSLYRHLDNHTKNFCTATHLCSLNVFYSFHFWRRSTFRLLCVLLFCDWLAIYRKDYLTTLSYAWYSYLKSFTSRFGHRNSDIDYFPYIV